MNNSNEPPEVLELVDEQDEVIGEVEKSEAHKDPSLIHREITVFLYDDQNRLLFQQRSRNETKAPLKWGHTCAGHVTKGLTPEQAAHMELKEELGIDVDLVFIGKNIDRRPDETRIIYDYIGKYSGEKIKINEKEVEQVKLLKEQDVDNLIDQKAQFLPHAIEFARTFWKK